jgi:hypothetical protein
MLEKGGEPLCSPSAVLFLGYDGPSLSNALSSTLRHNRHHVVRCVSCPSRRVPRCYYRAAKSNRRGCCFSPHDLAPFYLIVGVMPKLTSLSAPASNKENIAPTASKSRRAKVSLEEENEVDDEIVQLNAPPKRAKGTTGASINKQTKSIGSRKEAAGSSAPKVGSSSDDSHRAKRSRSIDQDTPSSDERKSRRELVLEERLALVSQNNVEADERFPFVYAQCTSRHSSSRRKTRYRVSLTI